MIPQGTEHYEILPTSIATVAINASQSRVQVLLTTHRSDAEYPAHAFALPCASYVPEEREEQMVQRCLRTEIIGQASILQIQRLGIFFHTDPPENYSLAILALMEAGVPAPGAAWWAIDALPELARKHVPILVYAIKALRLKLARTQDVLAIFPAELSLQQVRLLISTLEQVIGNGGDHAAPIWA